jgi:Rrf2 family protein
VVKISKKIEYALMVLKFMSERSSADQRSSDDRCSAREICDRFKIPFDTTAKVMQIMNNQGILSSCQGVKGGYQLQADLAKVSYLQLAEIIEGNKIWTDCELSQCGLIDSCNITEPIKRLNQYLSYFFQGLSIEELLQEHTLLPTALVQNVTVNVNKQKEKNTYTNKLGKHYE